MPAGRRTRTSSRQRRREVGHVAQRDRAHDEIDRVVGERQVVQVRFVERAVGHLRAGTREHLRRRVDADHRVAERRQVLGVPAGPAGRVESDADGQAVEDLAHDRLLDLEELIARLVVERRPARVAFARRDRTRLDARAELVRRLEKRLDLAEARLA